MKALRGIDLKRAQLVPSSVFADPDEVVALDGLSLPQKLAILRRWEFDARRRAGFAPDGAEVSMLSRIQGALRAMASEAGIQPARPTDSLSGLRSRISPPAKRVMLLEPRSS